MSVKAENSEIPVVESRQIQQTSASVWMRRISSLAPLWTLLVMFIIFSLASENFRSPANLNNILVQVSTWGILATGMTFVLLTGQIDLSVAAMMGLTGMISAQLFLNLKYPEPIPTAVGLGVATLLGFVSGLISTRFRIPTFMATLAMSLIAEGLTMWISQGRTIFDLSPVSVYLGSGRIGGDDGIKVLIIVAALCLLIGHLVLRYTRFGRYIYMTGANASAARLAGVNTSWIIVAALTICGFTAGLAGLVNQGRLGSALPAPIGSFLIDAIAVVVLGGTSLTGGRGSIFQTVIGLLIYGTLRNGLDNIANIDSFMKVFITGVVLLVALIVNVVFSGKAERDRT